MPSLSELTVKIFADGADMQGMIELYRHPLVKGLTTNPTLMRKDGVKDYEAFARDVLQIITDKPISFEVLSDDFVEMRRQALKIGHWQDNVYVKIPITNTRGQTAIPLIKELTQEGIRVNVTAILTIPQVEAVVEVLADSVPSIVSIFAGRIADTGRDPVPVMREARALLKGLPRTELLWASVREILNILQADASGCHIVTIQHHILKKALAMWDMDLTRLSLETVRMFHGDAQTAGYTIATWSFDYTPMKETVLVTGGAGYKGCVLIPKLLQSGYRTIVYDLMLFGCDGLPRHPDLRVIQGDIRDTKAFDAALKGVQKVIHMACISNDPSFELDSSLSRSINFNCFEPMVMTAKKRGVRRFVYVSTSSVYGVSEAPEVTEEHPLVPLTDYNKYKGLCEPILLKYQSPDFTTVIMRPATVCGYSPRMRFDLTVNILTNHAINRGLITVFGGAQKRPNIHIEDITDLYVKMLEYPDEKIAGEKFNAGYENHTVAQLAEIVKRIVEEEFPAKAPIRIETTSTNDNRSYHVSSRKIAEKLGWRPQRTIDDAVRDLCRAFREGKFTNSMTNDEYINVRTVKKIGLK